MRAIVSLLVAAALVLGAVVAVRAYRDRPAPFTPAALHLSLTGQVVASTEAEKVLAAQGAPTRMQVPALEPRQLYVGRLRYTPPAPKDGQQLFLVLSGPSGTLSSSLQGSGPTEDASRGWDGRYSQLATRSWLSGARDTHLPDGSFTNASEALYLPATGPLDFVAELPADVTTTADVTVTVVLQRDDDLLWAQRV
jgi:hypothetical protein